jgi:hypothetical protein
MRQQVDVYVSGPATEVRWSWEDVVVTTVPMAEPASDLRAFYARMAQEYDAMPRLARHDHDRPGELKPF